MYFRGVVRGFRSKAKKKTCKNFLSSALLFVLIIKLILKWKNVFDDTMMSIYAFAVEF